MVSFIIHVQIHVQIHVSENAVGKEAQSLLYMGRQARIQDFVSGGADGVGPGGVSPPG